MIDAHCHLNFQAFDKDAEEVIKRAQEKNIKIINVGTSLDSSKIAIELAEKHNDMFATVGIHPHHADKLSEDYEVELEKLARHPKVVAIGETGIDYFYYDSNGITNKNLQKELFIKQIQIAHKLNLPLMIHNRQAGEDILEVLNENNSLLKNPPGLFHCFLSALVSALSLSALSASFFSLSFLSLSASFFSGLGGAGGVIPHLIVKPLRLISGLFPPCLKPL